MHLTITTWKITVCVYYWIFTYCPPKIFYEFRINAFWTAFWILLSLCDDRLCGVCGNCVFCQCHVMCNARPNFNLHAILSSNTWALFQHSNHQPGYLSQCVPVVGVCLVEFEIFVQCVFIPQEWAPRTPCTGTEYMILYSLKMNWSNAEWCWKCF